MQIFVLKFIIIIESNMKVYITRKIPDTGIEFLKSKGIETIVWPTRNPMSPEELNTAAASVDAMIIMSGDKIDAKFLQNNSHLKAISNYAVGFDNIDIAAATKFGIPIGNTPDVLSEATADIAFLLMLNVSRKAFYHHKRILNRDWDTFQPTLNLGISLRDKTLGVFGLGRIGLEMARRCKYAYNMNIIYHNRSRNEEIEKELDAKYVDFDTLLKESDVISLHAALTEETKGRFNATAFSKMKKNAIFVNTARGGMHDEKALLAALENGEIWGAGLDVTNPEPMQADHPLLNMPNVCILPHIGSATQEARSAMSLRAAENVFAGLEGKILPFIVNKEVYGC